MNRTETVRKRILNKGLNWLLKPLALHMLRCNSCCAATEVVHVSGSVHYIFLHSLCFELQLSCRSVLQKQAFQFSAVTEMNQTDFSNSK